MAKNSIANNTWQEDPKEIIILANKSQHNFILEMPTGRYRLDAGRRMRTLRSILKIGQVQILVNEGKLVVEQ
jgi:hypothetical protein